MRMMDNCHICGNPATQSCGLCGSVTCDKHLVDWICLECRKGKKKTEISEEGQPMEDVYS